MIGRRPTRLGVAVALSAALLPCGCGGADKATDQPAADERETPGVFNANAEPPPVTYTVTRGEYNAALPSSFAESLPGLEVLSWVTADTGGRVATAMEDLDGLPEASPTELDRWARSGLRVRRIRLADLTGLIGAMPPTDALNRRAWGTVPQWQPAISARQRVDRMRIYDGVLDRDPGSTPRLLMRGWVEPRIEGGRASASVRVELAPQFHASRRAAFEPVATLSRAADEGTVLRELLLSVSLESGTAMIVTAEPPAEESPIGAGPPVPSVRTLGSVLFRSEPGPTPPPREGEPRRAGPPALVTVLVVVPVVPSDASGVAGAGNR